VDAVKHVLHQLPIKLIIYVLDKLHIQRTRGMEKNDMIDALIQYADAARPQFQRLQSGDINVIYEHWTVKELKQALNSKGVDTSTMLERSELQQAAYKHNIRNKVPVKASNKTPAPSASIPVAQPVQTPSSQQSSSNQQQQQQQSTSNQQASNNTSSSQPQQTASRPSPSPQPDTTQQSNSTQSHAHTQSSNQSSSSYSYTSVPPTATGGASNCTYNVVNAGGTNVYSQTFVNHNTNVNINHASADATPDNCAVA